MKQPRKPREPRIFARKKAATAKAEAAAAAASEETLESLEVVDHDPEQIQPDGGAEYSSRIAEYLIERDLLPEDGPADDRSDEPEPLTTLRAIEEMERYLDADSEEAKDVDGFLVYLESVGIR